MSDKPSKNILLDHNYDGIQELDNPLPNWWFIAFLITIVFSFFYFLHYEIAKVGPSLLQELTMDMEKLPKPTLATSTESEEQLAAMAVDIKLGHEVFVGKCAACHGQNGEGVIGPNLTDKFWLHGKGLRVEILNTIRKGVEEKGMPAWDSLLKAAEIYSVAFYIYSLKGSNPANGKAPQGTEIK